MTNIAARSFMAQLQVAYATRQTMVEHFLGLSILRGQNNVEKWMKESTQPQFKDGEWHSAYRLVESKCSCSSSSLVLHL